VGRLGSRVPALGIRTLSDLQIDVDKDWRAHGIYNLGDLTPKVDGAYNIGSSAVEFSTVYAKTGPPPGANSIGREELKEPAVDTAYLYDDAATSAKVGPSVDLEFVRSNDNTVAGGITPKVDGAYNLGNSANKFDTVYGNNFPGAGVANFTYIGLTAKKGLLLSGANREQTSFAIKSVSSDAWIREYTSGACFDTDKINKYGVIGQTLPKFFNAIGVPNKSQDIRGLPNLSVSLVPDGTRTGAGFSTPTSGPRGLTWDGTYIWYADDSAVYIYQMWPDGTLQGGFAHPGPSPIDLSWDGVYFWIVDNTADYIYQTTTGGTSTGGGFTSPAPGPAGIAWDGAYLWHADEPAAYIYKLNPDGTQTGAGFIPPPPGPCRLGWDGTYLWNTDTSTNHIYQIKTDGTQAGVFVQPGPVAEGVAWDGIYLWHTDYSADYVYQLCSASGIDITYQIATIS